VAASTDVSFDGKSCSILITRPADRLVLVRFSGHDVGEFGQAPMKEIEKDLERGPVELYINAADAKGASIGVSSEWAHWLAARKRDFHHVSMLTGSRFIQLSAEFVRRYAALDETMRIYTDSPAFTAALASSIARGQPSAG
jgi:hypothetical protein